MSTKLLIIECGKCGLTALETPAESEASAAGDAIGPLMRHCEQCGRTTGWLPWRRRSNDELLNPGRIAARVVPPGQERLASQSELAVVSKLLRQRNAARSGRTHDQGISSHQHEDEEDEEGINRFLLCTIVWGVAREVRAKTDTNGERLPLQRIAREVLRSYLQEAPGQYLLEEEALEEAIKRRLAELFKQSRAPHAEEFRFDINSLIAAEHTKRSCRNAKR
jgi:hypothetical protein